MTIRATSRSAQVPSSYPRLWIGYLAVGGLAVVAYYLVPDGVATAAIYQLIGLSSVAAVLAGVWLHHPVRRAPWYLMAIGLGIWSIADGVGN